ncbi:hypothetical protein PC128_g12358 [Phytophthora cactorum]|nr:hypothetical protein PC128_g12358 [Phytophthora cactorum]
MPTRAWRSEEDLVNALESCTRELGALCGGLEVQQLQDDCENPDEDVDVGSDTLASLEEVASECAALLACLEAGEIGSDEEVEDEGMNSAVTDSNHEKDQQQPQEEESDVPFHLEAGLAHELDSFADELNEFLARLRVPTTEENTVGVKASTAPFIIDTVKLPDEEVKPCCTDNEENSNASVAPVATGIAAAIKQGNVPTDNYDGNVAVVGADEANLFFIENTVDETDEHKWQNCTENEENPSASAAGVDINAGRVAAADNDRADSSRKNEVFSERTKKAITLHVKRLALQKQRRCRSGNRVWFSTKQQEAPEQERVQGVKVAWPSFQSSSFQQHIMRQQFARRRVKKIKDAQRLVEAARLKGSKPISYHSKRNDHKSSKQSATYLDRFKPSCVHFEAPNVSEPRYLCAVYLYDLRRLGTTYITFSSLSQLAQRVRARFAIEEVVTIYREVTELVFPQSDSMYRNNRKRHVKRQQRVSTLEQINDGDTLCVTQNAYDDMTILCDWIKQRQRIVHDFQYEVRQPRTDVSLAFTDENSIPSKPKVNNKPKLWDSNGRSIGVQAKEIS